MIKTITVAGGCFWGVEEYYRRLKGVESTRVGYAQGHKMNPSYQEVCTGETGHAEAVELHYDEKLISLKQIIDHLFRMIDPTSLNKQGNDIGTQYRVGIYPEDEEILELVQVEVAKRQKDYDKPFVLEMELLENFYDAEAYHQKYLIKNPGGYCHVNMNLIRDDEKK